MTTQTYTVSGMTCGHCVQSVTEEVSAIEGVSNVVVTLETGELKFEAELAVADVVVADAVKEAGYEVVA
jgi:copper chaperone CopZ